MNESVRWSRQWVLPGWDEQVQQALQSASIAVIGCGGLGSQLVMMLASAGVGQIEVWDDDPVQWSNLPRQWMFQEREVGSSKVLAAQRWVNDHVSSCTLVPIQERFHERKANQLTGKKVVLDATDRVSSKLSIGKACEWVNVPWIMGAVEQGDGQVTTLEYDNEQGRRFRYSDFFGTEISDAALGSCQARGVLGPSVSMIASVQALEAIQVITGKPTAWVGKMFCWDGLRSHMHAVSL